jgi:hypothetical protein
MAVTTYRHVIKIVDTVPYFNMIIHDLIFAQTYARTCGNRIRTGMELYSRIEPVYTYDIIDPDLRIR